MKITDIKQQVKRQDRYSIFVDGRFSFALSDSELISQSLKIGAELSAKELEDIKNVATVDKGVYRVLNLISRRPRSRWEIEDYLKRKKYKSEEIARILKIIDEKGYIDDLDFSKRWVANRRLLRPTSKRKLRMELKQKRISDETIDKALEEDEADETAILIELIDKKRRQTRYKDDQKLIAYLSRQGFNYSDIKEAMGS